MRYERQRIVVGAIAVVAVAAILSLSSIPVGAEPNSGKGKGTFKLDQCPQQCTDVCDPTQVPQGFELCAENRNGEAFNATFACCCCGEEPLGNFWRSSPK